MVWLNIEESFLKPNFGLEIETSSALKTNEGTSRIPKGPYSTMLLSFCLIEPSCAEEIF